MIFRDKSTPAQGGSTAPNEAARRISLENRRDASRSESRRSSLTSCRCSPTSHWAVSRATCPRSTAAEPVLVSDRLCLQGGRSSRR